MRLRVGFDWVVESGGPTPTAAIVAPHRNGEHRVLAERLTFAPETALHTYIDDFQNTVWRYTAPAGPLHIRHDLIVEVSGAPDPVLPSTPDTPVDQIPDDLLLYVMPSRHAPSDMVIGDAWRLFGDTAPGWARVQAVCDWVHSNISYGYGNSIVTTSGYDAYLARKGVCRDFAHIAVMFCRALNMPTRYAYGYLPDIAVPYNPTPMDFHAWFEVYLDGAWHTFDARHNFPRIGRVLIAHGRDAVDTAIMTSFGNSQLTNFVVWADEVGEDVTLDTPLPTPSNEQAL